MKALNAVKGNISGGQKALQKALRKVVLPDAAYGKLFLAREQPGTRSSSTRTAWTSRPRARSRS